MLKGEGLLERHCPQGAPSFPKKLFKQSSWDKDREIHNCYTYSLRLIMKGATNPGELKKAWPENNSAMNLHDKLVTDGLIRLKDYGFNSNDDHVIAAVSDGRRLPLPSL